MLSVLETRTFLAFFLKQKETAMKPRKFLPVVICFYCLLTAPSSYAAYEFYVSIEGATQGQFKGESTDPDHADQLVGIGYEHEIRVPPDTTTAQTSGRRQHGPIRIIKEFGAATPQIMQALVTNEMLPAVVIQFVRNAGQTGAEEVYHKITLVNATVSRIQQHTGFANALVAESTVRPYDTMELESVDFTYQRIVHESIVGGTSASDSWLPDDNGRLDPLR
jgi:type VI secretion system secreted protein Hcp